MRKKYLIAFILVLLICGLSLVRGSGINEHEAGNHNAGTSKSDTLTVDNYIKLSFDDSRKIPFAIYNCFEALELAKKLKYQKGIDNIEKSLKYKVQSSKLNFDLGQILNNDANVYMTLYDSLGYYYLNNGHEYKALECFRSIERIRNFDCGTKNGKLISDNPEKSALKGIADCYKKIGINYHKKEDNYVAIEFYKKALTIYNGLNDRLGIGKCSNNIGICYFNSGNYILAADYYFKALKTYEEFNHKKGLANAELNIGILFKQIKDNSQCTEYIQKALRIYIEINDMEGSTKCYNIMGGICYDQGNFVKAIEFFKQALRISEEFKNMDYVARILNNIGDSYIGLGDISTSLEYFNKVSELNKKNNDKLNEADLCINMAKINVKLEKYNIALDYALKSLKFSKEIKMLEIENNSYKILTQIYKIQGNYREALECSILDKKTGDSLLNSEKHKQILEIQTKYEINKKDRQIFTQNNELFHQNRKIVYLSMSALLILILSISMFVFYYKRNIAYRNLVLKNVEISKQSYKIREIEKELSFNNEQAATEKDLKNKINVSTYGILKNDELLKQLVEKVENEKIYLRQDITLDILAKEMETNRDYLSKVINANFGNFNEFINNYRIEEVIRILTSDKNHKPIKAICFESGFSNYNPFHNAFKKQTGLTPGDFKKRLEV